MRSPTKRTQLRAGAATFWIFALGLGLVACAGTNTGTPPTSLPSLGTSTVPSTSPLTDTTTGTDGWPMVLYTGNPAPEAPTAWVGIVAAAAGDDAVMLSSEGLLSVAARIPADSGSEGSSTRLESISIGQRNSVAWLGRCCEPAAGSLWMIDLSAETPSVGFALDGLATDLGGGIRAVVSGTGDLAVYREADTKVMDFLFGVGARSAAVDPKGVVVALASDVSLLDVPRAFDDRLTVEWYWYDAEREGYREHKLPSGFQACSVTWSYAGNVFILDRVNDLADAVCLGSTLHRFDPSTGSLDGATLALDGLTSTIRVDASGTYVIYATATGEVKWKSLYDSSGAALANGPYVAVDW